VEFEFEFDHYNQLFIYSQCFHFYCLLHYTIGEKCIYLLYFNDTVSSLELEDRGIDRRMESEWIFGRSAGGVQWIHLAQNRDRWRALVNTMMNLRVWQHGISKLVS
jgi:hypothetical protein